MIFKLAVIILAIIALGFTFLILHFVGCMDFSPWVMANNGIKFMPWCN